MFPKPVAWIVAGIFIAGTVFVGHVYEIIGVMGAGALSILTFVCGFFVIKLESDRRTKILLMVALFGFTARRIWDMAIATGVLPWSADAPGDAASFTPVASYTGVRDFISPEARLVSLRAERVRSDGTIDLTACGMACVRYEFLAPRRYPVVESNEGAPDSAGPGEHLYEVELYRESGRHLTDMFGSEDRLEGRPWPYHWGRRKPMSRKHRGVPSDKPAVLEDPTCAFAGLWKQAIAAGHSKDAEAVITYDARGYHLRIGEDVHLRFGRDCNLKAVVRLEYACGGHRGLRPEIFVDGKSAGIFPWVYREGNMRVLWLDPGEHTFRGVLRGQPDRQTTVRVAAGEYREVELERPRRRTRDD